MKNSGKCPKCGSAEIYNSKNTKIIGERQYLSINIWGNKLKITAYTCTNCGYLEEYLSEETLQNQKRIMKLKEKWSKS